MYTGLYCIDWIGDMTRKFAAVPEIDGSLRSDDGIVHVLQRSIHFSRLVKGAFETIRQSSTNNPAVKIRLLQTFASLRPHLTTDQQVAAVREQAEAVWQMASQETLTAIDREDFKVSYDTAMSVLKG
jgi:uncharacterized membrane protein